MAILDIHFDLDEIIERLKADGWTIPVRCKDCKWYQESKLLAPNKFCFKVHGTICWNCCKATGNCS